MSERARTEYVLKIRKAQSRARMAGIAWVILAVSSGILLGLYYNPIGSYASRNYFTFGIAFLIFALFPMVVQTDSEMRKRELMRELDKSNLLAQSNSNPLDRNASKKHKKKMTGARF